MKITYIGSANPSDSPAITSHMGKTFKLNIGVEITDEVQISMLSKNPYFHIGDDPIPDRPNPEFDEVYIPVEPPQRSTRPFAAPEPANVPVMPPLHGASKGATSAGHGMGGTAPISAEDFKKAMVPAAPGAGSPANVLPGGSSAAVPAPKAGPQQGTQGTQGRRS